MPSNHLILLSPSPPATGEGNGKPLQYSCLENPINSMKRLSMHARSKAERALHTLTDLRDAHSAQVTESDRNCAHLRSCGRDTGAMTAPAAELADNEGNTVGKLSALPFSWKRGEVQGDVGCNTCCRRRNAKGNIRQARARGQKSRAE